MVRWPLIGLGHTPLDGARLPRRAAATGPTEPPPLRGSGAPFCSAWGPLTQRNPHRDEDFWRPNTVIAPGSGKRGTYLNADRAGQPTKGCFCPPGEGRATDAGPGSARSQAGQKGLLEMRCSLPKALKRPSGASRRASWRQLLRP